MLISYVKQTNPLCLRLVLPYHLKQMEIENIDVVKILATCIVSVGIMPRLEVLLRESKKQEAGT